MGTDKCIFLNHDFTKSLLRPSRSPIKMGKNRRPEADGAIISDDDRFRMDFIDILNQGETDISTYPGFASDFAG